MSGTETRAGEAEAVEAVKKTMDGWVEYPPAGLAQQIVRAAYPIIAAAVRAEHGEQIAAELRDEATRYRTRASRTPRSNTLKAAALALDDFAAARLAREAQS